MNEIIWETKIDPSHLCVVTRTGDNTGRLVVKNSDSNNTILDQEVSIEFGSSGVSTKDVIAWYDLAKTAIAS